jgi:amino acid adenylation domain-containing protein
MNVLDRPAGLLPGGVTARHPLAEQQRGLWYLQQLAPHCGAYHLLFSAEARLPAGNDPATFDATHLREALASMCAAHDVLRTSLTAEDGEPWQWVHAEVTPDIRLVDATGLDDDALRERARADSRVPFDLSVPPLWRVHLYDRGDGRVLAVMVAHHALLDFWSLGLVLQDFLARAGLADATTAAATATIDGAGFGDYAAVQSARRRAASTDGAGDPSLAFWREKLRGLPPTHGIPLDRPRPATQAYEGRSLAFALGAEASEGVRRLARDAGATPFMVLLSAYAVLVRRLGREDDVVIASPVAGRTDRRQRQQLGQFVNTVLFRVDVDLDQSFSALLAQVRATVVDGMRYQDCGFSTLVEALAPVRDPSMPPLAQIAFAWERLPLLQAFENFFLHDPADSELALGALRLHPFAVPQQEGQFDLALEMGGERDGAYQGVLKYQSGLWELPTLQRFVASFSRLVEDLVADPQAPLHAARLADDATADAWLRAGDGPVRTLDGRDTLQAIAAQVARTPEAIAVIDGATQWSYATLWRRAGQVARALRAHGVGAGDLVGLMLPRDARLLVALLGIWRAQAAYVPLDPDFPADRLRHIADDAALSALVSERALQAEWPTTAPAVCLDALADDAEVASDADVAEAPAGEIAYVMFTSGSTGKPKGVSVGHRSVANFLESMRELLAVGADARLLAVTTPAFDISVLELLLPLIVGARTCIADGADIRDGQRLMQRIEDWNIDLMQATPATWKMLVDAGWAGAPRLLALCGGDALSSQLAVALLERTTALWNVYGPTETTVWSTAARIVDAERIPIGTCLHNTQAYVLDERFRPVPPGTLGELWIGGDGLAIGYWNRPELTEDRFRVLDTLPEAGRLYRTGDLVRWHDGRFEHHGRLDFQVKLRGYRIELGEIENALRTLPGVSDAVVGLREDRPGDKRLVAYVIATADAAETALSPAELRAGLRQSLPEYMVPSAFVRLEAFPQTANRKIDRKALPKPEEGAIDTDYVAPRDALEIGIAAQFAALLGIERVGLHDGFFDLGGHSLLAVQLVAALKRDYGVELAVSELVQAPTVAELACRVRGDGDAARTGLVIELKKATEVRPLWLFHPIGGNIFCYLELARALAPGRPVLAVQSPAMDADGEAEVTVEAMAARYLVELRERQPHGPYLLGGWCFGGVIAFEVARQLRAQGETVERILAIDTRAPIEANVPDDADDATLLSWFARDLATPYGKTLTVAPDTLRALPNEAMFAHVLDAAKAIGVLPQDADERQIARYFEAYMANGMALRMYFPEPEPLPVLLFVARDETEDFGPQLGWDTLVGAALESVEVAGDHNSVMYSPQIAEVAARIDGAHPIQPLQGSAS